MPGLDCLNVAMAACWKFVWNVDPLALIVPLAAAADDEDEAPPVVGLVPVVDELELDEEHAASRAIAMTAPPAVTACFLPRSCMTNLSPLSHWSQDARWLVSPTPEIQSAGAGGIHW